MLRKMLVWPAYQFFALGPWPPPIGRLRVEIVNVVCDPPVSPSHLYYTVSLDAQQHTLPREPAVSAAETSTVVRATIMRTLPWSVAFGRATDTLSRRRWRSTDTAVIYASMPCA